MSFCLDDEGDGSALQVEDGRGVPVLGGVDVALGRRDHHQMVEPQGELDDPVPELQLLPGVVGNVP